MAGYGTATLYVDIVFRGVQKQVRLLNSLMNKLKEDYVKKTDVTKNQKDSFALVKRLKAEYKSLGKILTDIASSSEEIPTSIYNSFNKRIELIRKQLLKTAVTPKDKDELKEFFRENFESMSELGGGEPFILKSLQRYKFYNLKTAVRDLLRIKRDLGTSSEAFKKQIVYVQEYAKRIGYSRRALKRLINANKEFSFSFLTFLFAGMMLKRFFGGFFKNIIDNYKKITGLTTQFTRSSMKLSASWSYVKFAIGNALNNPFIINAIEWFSDLLERVGNFFSEHPGVANSLMIFAGAMATLGSLSIAIGSIKQLKMLFDLFKGFFEAHTLDKATGIISSITASASPLLIVAGALVSIGTALYLLGNEKTRNLFKDTFRDGLKWAKDLGKSVRDLFTDLGHLLAGEGVDIEYRGSKLEKTLSEIGKFFIVLINSFEIGFRYLVEFVKSSLEVITTLPKLIAEATTPLGWGKLGGDVKELYNAVTSNFKQASQDLEPQFENINSILDSWFKPQNEINTNNSVFDILANDISNINNAINPLLSYFPQLEKQYKILKTPITDTSSALANVNTELTNFKNYSDNSDEIFAKEQSKWETLSKKVQSLKDELNKLNGMNVTYTTTHIIKTKYMGGSNPTPSH